MKKDKFFHIAEFVITTEFEKFNKEVEDYFDHVFATFKEDTDQKPMLDFYDLWGYFDEYHDEDDLFFEELFKEAYLDYKKRIYKIWGKNQSDPF